MVELCFQGIKPGRVKQIETVWFTETTCTQDWEGGGDGGLIGRLVMHGATGPANNCDVLAVTGCM